MVSKKKIMVDHEKFLQEYNKSCLQMEARIKYLEQKDHELKKKELKLKKDREKLQLNKTLRKVVVLQTISQRKLHFQYSNRGFKGKPKSFESLQSEIMKLEIALQAIEENDGIALEEELEDLQKKVVEKDEQVQEVKSLSKTLSLRNDRNNVELQDARQVLIDGFEMHPFCGEINTKTMGMLDSTPFFNPSSSSKTTKKNATNFKLVCRHLKDPKWHPFKLGLDKKEIIDEKDEKMVGLKGKCSEEQYVAVVRALNEMNEYGNDHVQELWNFKEERKASLKEGIRFILKEINN